MWANQSYLRAAFPPQTIRLTSSVLPIQWVLDLHCYRNPSFVVWLLGEVLQASLVLLSASLSPQVLLCCAASPDVFLKNLDVEFLEVDKILLSPAQRIQSTLTLSSWVETNSNKWLYFQLETAYLSPVSISGPPASWVVHTDDITPRNKMKEIYIFFWCKRT